MSAETGKIESPFYAHATSTCRVRASSVHESSYRRRSREGTFGSTNEVRARQADLNDVFRGESPHIVLVEDRSLRSWDSVPITAPSYYCSTRRRTGRSRSRARTRRSIAQAGATGAVQLSRARRRRDSAYLTRPLDARDRCRWCCYLTRPAALRRGRLRLAGHALARAATPCCSRLSRLRRFGEKWEKSRHGEWGIGVMQTRPHTA